MSRSHRTWRILAVSALVLGILAGVAWFKGFFSRRTYPAANSLIVLMPYRHAGTWVFDDPSVGLKREPFVSGIPEIIDGMVKEIPDAQKGFRLLFSTQPFPGYTEKLTWRRGGDNGNWYYAENQKREGWLCPALFKYYPQAPRELYAKAEKL